MKNILITGASGYIASLIRRIYLDSNVYLFSRKDIEIRENELYFQSESLDNVDWWKNFHFKKKFDIIFHLAEPVKTIKCNNEINNIVDSHVYFLRMASLNSEKVIYPISAYKYDNILSKKNYIYSNLKYEVMSNLIGINNIYYPVIHPILDNPKSELIKFVKIFQIYSSFNLFLSSEASIPYLTENNFIKEAGYFHINKKNEFDVYTGFIKFSNLFYSNDKISNIFLSKLFLYILSFFRFIPAVNLILYGRKIHEKNS